jgi:hypothetical protein
MTPGADLGRGGPVASIIAHTVFCEIIDISRSTSSTERRDETVKRVALFKADTTSAGHPRGVIDSLEDNLRRYLEDALDNHELPADELSVLLAALDALTGPED